MAHERWTNRALKTLMVAVFAISSVWFGQADGRASDDTPCDWQTREGCCDPDTGNECSPCPTALAIVGARQTGHLYTLTAGSGSPPQGTAVIEVEVAWPGSISHPLNGTPGWDDRSLFLETAGVHEIKVWSPPPGAKDIVDSQQPKTHDYELTFQSHAGEHCSAADGTVIWPNDQTFTETASITWTPLPSGCYHHLPFELPCYSRTLTLDIARNVFSGKITEPAGGTRCSSTGASQDIVVRIVKAIDCQKCFEPVAKVTARGGVFSKRFDLSKPKFKVLRKGTFAAWVDHGPETGVSHTCGSAGSAPVKKT